MRRAASFVGGQQEVSVGRQALLVLAGGFSGAAGGYRSVAGFVGGGKR